LKRGSVKRLGSSYRARIEIAPRDGKRRWDTKVLPTEKEAEKYCTKVLAALDADQYVRSEAMTFDTLCELYLKASAGRIEPTSARWYERILRDHVRATLGPMKITKIKPLHVQAVLNAARDVSKAKSKVGKALAASSRKNLLVGMRAVFAWGVRMELIARNPATHVDTPKVAQREYPEFDPETLRSIFKAIDGTEFKVLAPFALLTGARRGEVAALHWQDIDLQRGRYSIRRSAAILDGKQIYKSPKSQRSRRTEALPPSLVALLEGHRKDQARRHDRIGLGLPSKDTPVFDRENGEAWNVNELSRRWSRFVKRKKLPAIRWHDLRHGFASLSHDAGESLHSISTALGHSSLGITSSTYVHCFDETKRRRAERLDAYLSPAVRDKNVTSEGSESTETA
jgi:integrase